MIKHAKFQLYRVHPDGVILENLTFDDKFANKRARLFLHQTMCREEKIIISTSNNVAK